ECDNAERVAPKTNNLSSYWAETCCRLCNQTFKGGGLHSHWRSKHIHVCNDFALYKMEMTFETETNDTNLINSNNNSHSKWNEDEVEIGVFACSVCQRFWATLKSMQSHVNSYHSVSQQQFVECPLCAQQILGRSQLSKHLSKHFQAKDISGKQLKHWRCTFGLPKKCNAAKHRRASQSVLTGNNASVARHIYKKDKRKTVYKSKANQHD
ncbi:hypothetical protein RFI_24085, partial [Reticulomyxa filosa]